MNLIDNLKDINNMADLFQYIYNIEQSLEAVKQERDRLLILLDTKTNSLKELEKQLHYAEMTLEYVQGKAGLAGTSSNE